MKITTEASLLPLKNSEPSDGKSLQDVAQQFEAMLMGELLKVMRQSIESSGLFEGSSGMDIYTEMVDQQVALSLSRQGGLGLAGDIRLKLDALSRSVGDQSSLGTPHPNRKGSSADPLAASVGSRKGNEDSSYRVSSDFGWRQDPITGETRYHRGVDLAAPKGTAVAAVTSGSIRFSGWQKGYGNTVVLENEQGIRTRYAHLSEVFVEEGQNVSARQTIGRVGQSGRATGPHLHLEVEKDGRRVDPFKAGILPALAEDGG